MPPGRLTAYVPCCRAAGSGLLEGDEDAADAARADATLHVNGRDRLQRPALGAVLVQDLFELVAGHLSAHQSFTKLDDLVLRHALPPCLSVRRAYGEGHPPVRKRASSTPNARTAGHGETGWPAQRRVSQVCARVRRGGFRRVDPPPARAHA